MLRKWNECVSGRLAGLLVVLLCFTLCGGVIVIAITEFTALKTRTAKLAAGSWNATVIGNIKLLMNDGQGQIMLALQHNPADPLYKLHDHDVQFHLDQVLKNQSLITGIWKDYLAQELGERERQIADRYAGARMHYAEKGLLAARTAILAGDYGGANLVLVENIDPLYKEALAAAAELERLYFGDAAVASEAVAAAEADFAKTRNAIMAATVLAATLAGGLGFFVAHSIARPLTEVVANVDHAVVFDDFTRTTPLAGASEIGKTASALNGSTDKRRQVVCDVRQSSSSVAEYSDALASSVQKVPVGSQSQSEAIAAVAATIEMSILF